MTGRAGGHSQAILFGVPSEVQIITVQFQSLVEPYVLRQQGFAALDPRHASEHSSAPAGVMFLSWRERTLGPPNGNVRSVA
jgi:hypothetical protein